jgi:hypothetical protein
MRAATSDASRGEKRTNSLADTSTELDLEIAVTTKKHRLENGQSVMVKGNNGPLASGGPTLVPVTSQPAKEVNQVIDTEVMKSCSDIDIRYVLPLKCVLVLYNFNGCSTSNAQPETESSGPQAEAIHRVSVDADRQAIRLPLGGSKRAATQLKEIPKARVSFASAGATGGARTIPKRFVPLDLDSIRRGFQKGGASSKKEDLKKGT